MVAVTVSLRTGQILSVVDHGPKPGDDEWMKPVAEIIAERIVREGLQRQKG